MEKRYLTEKEVAEILRVTPWKLQEDRSKKRGLPYIKLGKGKNAKVLYDIRAVEEYLKKHTVIPEE
jgi:hypothetical protein